MTKNEKIIKIRCAVHCPKCNEEKHITSLFSYTYKEFPNYSRKQFYELANTDYDKFERLIKDSLSFTCERCGSTMNIAEIYDMQYVALF